MTHPLIQGVSINIIINTKTFDKFTTFLKNTTGRTYGSFSNDDDMINYLIAKLSK